MLRLEDLIGKNVALALANSEKGIYRVTLHGVENGGIWIESKEMEKRINSLRRRPKNQPLKPKQKPIFFVPYAQIVFLVASSIELDESSFEE